ncbi:MAG: hypothetical protein RLY85_859, partial [Bacteroidota bacterium]
MRKLASVLAVFMLVGMTAFA